MKTVTVVMSTYNGSTSVVRQLDSILAQTDVKVKCYIRDDGSKDDTLKILEHYKLSHSNVFVAKGKNVGWEKSFLLALNDAPYSDYYAFSDQDDVWFEDKLIKSINELEKHDKNKALLFHCNRISTDVDLHPLPHQAHKVPKPLSLENAVTQEYAQGCTIVINNTARTLVCRCLPENKIPHDFWTGIICYYFGEVYYSKEPLFYHINHGHNVSNAGHLRAGRLRRIKNLLQNNLYANPSQYLLEHYSELLINSEFLNQLQNYKTNIFNKISLFFNPKFRRVNWQGTILLKIALLINKI